MLVTIMLFLLLSVVLWFPLYRYLVPRFYLVVGDSMYPTLSEGDVVMGFRPHPSEPLMDGEIYGYRLPSDEKKWVVKRLVHHRDGKCFFQGDNPCNSVDSRDYGLVDRSEVMFKVYWHKDMGGKGGIGG